MITVFPQATVTGSLTSNPVLLPPGAVTAVLGTVMNSSDVTTPGHAVNLCLGWQSDYVTVGHGASCVWQSGASGAAPAISTRVPQNAAAVSVQIITSGPLSIGVTLDIQDAGGNSLFLVAPSGHGVGIDVPVPPVVSQMF